MVTLRGMRHTVLVGVLVAAFATGSVALAGDDPSDGSRESLLDVRLTGYEEDPAALSTTGAGQFRARIDDRAKEITYRLSYQHLEGAVTQAHIHFGGKAQSGGIAVFFCSNLGNGPAGTQACPPAPGSVTGTIRPGDVIGPGGQGIAAGEFDELVAAIRAGTAYANLHTAKYPGGEIRGQLGHQH